VLAVRTEWFTPSGGLDGTAPSALAVEESQEPGDARRELEAGTPIAEGRWVLKHLGGGGRFEARIGKLYEQYKSLGDTIMDTTDEQQVTKRRHPLPADRISGKLRSVLALAEDTIETVKLPLQTGKDLLAPSGDSVAARLHPPPS
jgi:hypothetical protein